MQPENLVGTSSRIRRIIGECEAIATSRSKVLLTGESGVGKEVFAHYIHKLSRRCDAPMITINCAGVPESLLESELFGHVRGSFTDAHRDRRGLLEAANHGTILLDEIGEMGMRMQTMLLRFLETGEIQRVGADQPGKPLDVRLIAATNRDLWADTLKKSFRTDLYYRLNVVHLVVPPLRERQDDIKPLLFHFLKLASTLENRIMPELTAEAVTYLEHYAWPGNVRELKNLAERLVFRCSGRAITIQDLPLEIGTPDVVEAAAADPWHRLVSECYDRMTIGRESFWTAVYEPFIHRDMTREAVRALVRRGLEETRGSYPLVVSLFNIPDEDYRKFMRFLHKHDCHMPIQAFRMLRSFTPPASAEPHTPIVPASAAFAIGSAV
ncbi:MAG: zraR 10 [Acidobacteria bacterium]|nr:zraR 10 [Acidobacteriota bacterium]